MPKQEEDWKKELTPEQYRVLREGGTDVPFAGKYVNHNENGTYTCAACNQPLFSSETKIESSSGWPSFHDVISKGNVELKEDRSHGMTRTEVVCTNCGSHLGHVFDDGPGGKTGLHYCINSTSLDFKKKGQLLDIKFNLQYNTDTNIGVTVLQLTVLKNQMVLLGQSAEGFAIEQIVYGEIPAELTANLLRDIWDLNAHFGYPNDNGIAFGLHKGSPFFQIYPFAGNTIGGVNALIVKRCVGGVSLISLNETAVFELKNQIRVEWHKDISASEVASTIREIDIIAAVQNLYQDGKRHIGIPRPPG